MRQLTQCVQKLDHILRISDLCEILSVDRTTIYRWSTQKNINFPEAIQLTPKTKGWLNSDIQDWINNKKR